jgi:hypothetical protein
MGDRAMKTSRRAARAALTLDECRIQASLLLKDLRSEDGPRARRAADRFQVLPHFRSREPDAILEVSASIRLKHALAVVAAELGYAAWADCKRRLETPANQRLDAETFFTTMGAAYLNRWFARYDEARASLEAEGGYLFPFRRQFFICEAGFLEVRDIDPTHPDWERIGHDWVRPRDDAARDRLERKFVAMGYGGRG